MTAGQVVVHAPQLSGSVSSETSQPLAASASQFSNPLTHEKPVHVPPTHWAVELAGLSQGLPQPPQLSGSFEVSDSQPLLGS